MSVVRLRPEVRQPLGLPTPPAGGTSGDVCLVTRVLCYFYTCNLCQDTELTSLQTRLQAGLVERLEEQLGQERARLGAMLDHLHQSPVSGDPISIPVLDHLHQSPVSPHPRTLAPSPASSSREQRPPQTYATMIRQVGT